MYQRILLLILLPFLGFSQVPQAINDNLFIKSSSFNLDELKVRWKKAALENCPGVPCSPSFTCGTNTVLDIDGNAYNTVLIGTQCWTKTNLKVTKYNDGALIGDSTTSTWGTALIGARTGYDISLVSLSDYVGTFGYLYNWYAVNDPRNLCPDGWHVPTDAEWTIMIQALDPSQAVNSGNVSTFTHIQSATAGTALKSNVTNPSMGSGLGWEPGPPGTNTSGFSALPGGFRDSGGSLLIRSDAVFWSATENGPSSAWLRGLVYGIGNVGRYDDINRSSGFYFNKSYGFSIRCLKD